MSRWTGTLQKMDLGTGVWVITTGSGEQLQLAGRIPGELEGKAVVVEGTTEDLQGIGMFAPSTIKVATIRPK